MLILARLEEKNLEQKLSTDLATMHVMLVFLKKKKVSILLFGYNLNTNQFLQLYVYDSDFKATIPCKLTKEEKAKMAAEKRNKKDWRP